MGGDKESSSEIRQTVGEPKENFHTEHCRHCLSHCPPSERNDSSWECPDVWVHARRHALINTANLTETLPANDNMYLNSLSLISKVSMARASAAFSTWATLRIQRYKGYWLLALDITRTVTLASSSLASLTHTGLGQVHAGASYRNLPELSPLLLPESLIDIHGCFIPHVRAKNFQLNSDKSQNT